MPSTLLYDVLQPSLLLGGKSPKSKLLGSARVEIPPEGCDGGKSGLSNVGSGKNIIAMMEGSPGQQGAMAQELGLGKGF